MSAEEPTVHHEEAEWEDQRENFTKYYMTEKKTLKEAARCMIDNHQFFATPRQWERKVKSWGLEKYTNRQDRLKQIESQGRSIHEVARVGRRPRAYDAGLLHPEHVDDRNVRRFARRELGRSGSNSRSRSRSNSFGHRSRSTSPMPESSEEVIQEDVFDLDLSPVLQSSSLHPNAGTGPVYIPAVPTDDDSFNTQAHVLQLRDTASGETSDEVFLSIPGQVSAQDHMQDVETLSQGQYNFAELDRRFSMDPQDAVPLHRHDVDASSPFPSLDTSFQSTNAFIASQTVAMEDISPTINRQQNGAWMPAATFSPAEADPSTNFLPETMPQSHSYHATPTSDSVPPIEFPNGIGLDTSAVGVPELIFPASPSPSHHSASTSGGHHQYTHQSTQPSYQDQQIYADFYASVNRFTQAVIDAVGTRASGVDDRIGGLNQLAEDLTVERGTFFQEMTMTLNNFVSTQQRAVQSIHEQCNHLKQQRNMLQMQKLTLERENLTMKQLVSQVPGAAEHIAHPHRFSLPGNYVFNAQPPGFATSANHVGVGQDHNLFSGYQNDHLSG